MNKPMVYTTVKKRAEAEFIEKKSRFIGHAIPVTTEAEAQEIISQIRSRYYDATHNVYAYILQENNIARFSDDGEPSGTAGMPVLEVMKKEGVTDCLIVSTRYFGGTLLGAGGLVRAYSKSAKMALDAAEIIDRIFCYEVEIPCTYDLLGKIRYLIENGPYILGDISYGEEILIKACIKYDLIDKFKKEITEATGGKISVTTKGERYI